MAQAKIFKVALIGHSKTKKQHLLKIYYIVQMLITLYHVH